MTLKIIKANILDKDSGFAKKIKNKIAGRAALLNIISSPGAGKTSLLEKALPVLIKRGFKVSVIEGDCATARDGERIKKLGVEAVQIITGDGCHLTAYSVYKALLKLNLLKRDYIFRDFPSDKSPSIPLFQRGSKKKAPFSKGGRGDLTAKPVKNNIIFIENVGNLVCPAEFDLGEDFKIVVLSVTEGDDKPLKYPLVFREARLVVLNKTDLVRHTDFSTGRFYQNLKKINRAAKVVETSARTGKGIKEFCDYIFSHSPLRKGGYRGI